MFRLFRVGSALAFSEVPIGEGRLRGHLSECTRCCLRRWVDPARYRSVEESGKPSPDEITQRTFAQLATVYARRLTLERELESGLLNLSPRDRAELLVEPFEAVSAMVDERFAASTTSDFRSTIAFAGTFLVPAGLFVYSCLYVSGPRQDTFLVLTGISLLVGIAWTVMELHLAPFRYVKRRIAPMVGKALRPLAPARSDIDECLTKCRAKGMKLGRVLKSEYVWRAVRGP